MTLAAQTGLRVDDILARGVAITWDEAVALVLAATRQVVVTAAPGFPSAEQTVLYREGTVVALATTDQSQVRGAAHLLAAVLGDDVPVKLRLLVSQAAGIDAPYASLKEFCDALAYFERPDPASLLRELFLRADAMPAPAADSGQPPPKPAALPPTPAPKTQATAKQKKASRWPIVTAVAVGLACLAVWFFGSRFGGMSALGVYTEAAALSEPLVETAPAAAKAAKERPRAAALENGVALRHRSSASTTNSAQWGAKGNRPSSLDLQGEAGALIPPIVRMEPLIPSFPSALATFRETPQDRANAVYSKQDPDVVPPQNVYPKLPSDPPGAQAGNRTVLELLISADGLVERVRLRTPPRNIHEFMLVSAAKAWRFDPATFHGRPVRFLHSLAITFPY